MSEQLIPKTDRELRSLVPEPDGGQWHSYAHYVCDMAETYGLQPPGRDEFDPRDIFIEESIPITLELANCVQALCPEGTQVGDDYVSLFSAIIGAFHNQSKRLAKIRDDYMDAAKQFDRDYDGTEIAGRQLEIALDRAKCAQKKVEVFDLYRDTLGKIYHRKAGQRWQPYRGTFKSQYQSGASMEAREFIAGLKASQLNDIPTGTRIGFSGPRSKDEFDESTVFAMLDAARKKYPEMVLIHSDNQGADQIASRWALRHDVSEIRCQPDWGKYPKNAGFVRNRDDFLDGCQPEFILVVPAKSFAVQSNLLQEARKRNVKLVYSRNGSAQQAE